jgi:ATP-dependent DNA helicase PIF1
MVTITLNKQQQHALDLVKTGKNVFITGSAGVGKSLLISKICDWGNECDKTICVTAMTGVAAANIGGATFHSWSGMGLGKADVRKHAFYIRKNKMVRDRYESTDILIIDEISAMDYEYFSKVNGVAQLVLGKLSAVFGGIQVVVCGDFFQLGPVQKGKKLKYLFEDVVWDRVIDETVHLTEVYRQTNQDFIEMLHRIRVGDVTDEIATKIVSTAGHSLENDIGIKPTILYCRNADVDAINTNSIRKLDGELNTFSGVDYFASDAYKKLYEKSFTLPKTLELKVGAQVMLIVNLNVFGKLVNGARGVVVKIQKMGEDETCDGHDEDEDDVTKSATGGVWVRFMTGATVLITPFKQGFKDDNAPPDGPDRVSRTQYPLRLAYALTIHKSQGLSIDYLEVDVRGCFAPGQCYVALSRATSFETLRVRNFEKRCVITSPVVNAFYDKMKCGDMKRVRGPLDLLMGPSTKHKKK